jgi:hypothetical protein
VATALIDSRVIASAEVACAGVEIKLLITNNGKTDNHNFALFHIKISLE